MRMWVLAEETVVNVGAVDGNVAAGTALIARVDHGVVGVVRGGDAAVVAGAEVAGAGMAFLALHGDGGAREEL